MKTIIRLLNLCHGWRLQPHGEGGSSKGLVVGGSNKLVDRVCCSLKKLIDATVLHDAAGHSLDAVVCICSVSLN